MRLGEMLRHRRIHSDRHTGSSSEQSGADCSEDRCRTHRSDCRSRWSAILQVIVACTDWPLTDQLTTQPDGQPSPEITDVSVCSDDARRTTDETRGPHSNTQTMSDARYTT